MMVFIHRLGRCSLFLRDALFTELDKLVMHCPFFTAPHQVFYFLLRTVMAVEIGIFRGIELWKVQYLVMSMQTLDTLIVGTAI